MTLVSGHIRRICGYSWWFLWYDSGVVDDGNFWRFRWLLLRKRYRYDLRYGDAIPLVVL